MWIRLHSSSIPLYQCGAANRSSSWYTSDWFFVNLDAVNVGVAKYMHSTDVYHGTTSGESRGHREMFNLQ